jgi:hypothetical protein
MLPAADLARCAWLLNINCILLFLQLCKNGENKKVIDEKDVKKYENAC